MRDYEAVKRLGMERLKTLTWESYERYAEQKNAQNKDLCKSNDMEEENLCQYELDRKS